MSWKGLTIESKSFCSYERKTPAGKLRWWLCYIFVAGPKFWFWTVRDSLR